MCLNVISVSASVSIFTWCHQSKSLSLVRNQNFVKNKDDWRHKAQTVLSRTIEREEADEGDLEDETSSISRLLVDECILPDSKIQEFVNILARTELKVQPEELLSSKVSWVNSYVQFIHSS